MRPECSETIPGDAATAPQVPIDPAARAERTLAPRIPLSIRPATQADLPFIDALQKANRDRVGFMPRMQLQQYIDGGHVLVAEGEESGGATELQSDRKTERQSHGDSEGDAIDAASGCRSEVPPVCRSGRLGYIIAKDRYFKRDDVGVIFQVCVSPGARRSLVGAALVQHVFERAAYGCKLFCCWCAQDIEANRFWESLGFVPLAFRAGGRSRRRAVGSRLSAVGGKSPHPGPLPGGEGVRGGGEGVRGGGEGVRGGGEGVRGGGEGVRGGGEGVRGRVHIFWQRRVRAGDMTTPLWYPCWTNAGAIREDRLVLPIPAGRHWRDSMPVVLPMLPPPGDGAARALMGERKREKPATRPRPRSTASCGLRFCDAAAVQQPPLPARPRRDERQPKPRLDRRQAELARELRDRYLEWVNEGDGEPVGLESERRPYEVGRVGLGRAGGGDGKSAGFFSPSSAGSLRLPVHPPVQTI